jgi:hypothetical protein
MTNPQKSATQELAVIVIELAKWPTDQCVLWERARTSAGYGNIRIGGRTGHNVKAHRLAYALTYGAISPGMVICHRCDNPPCINPRHLFMGTTLDNVRDKVVKGRQSRGETNAMSRLTESSVRSIRTRHADGETQRRIAADLAVSEATVSRVINGRLWGHVT